MNYTTIKEESLTQYENLKHQYDMAILSENFEKIRSEIIFDILKCRYLSDILQIYQNVDNNSIPKMNFKSGEEAKDIFLNIIHFKKLVNSLLDNVAYLDKILSLKEQINELVRRDDYLSDSLLIPSLGRIERITKDCLKELPEYQKNMTKEFKNHYLETCINSLSEDDLNVLVQNRIIRPDDLDHIRIAYDTTYNNKINYLCNILGHQPMHVIEMETKIKGTTFNNDDGSSRQQLLKELAEALQNGPQDIVIEPYMYKPELGQEEPAAKVLWNNKQLGYLDKMIVADVVQKYSNPQYSATIKSVREKDQNYGCKIDLTIRSPKMLTKESEILIEK